MLKMISHCFALRLDSVMFMSFDDAVKLESSANNLVTQLNSSTIFVMNQKHILKREMV